MPWLHYGNRKKALFYERAIKGGGERGGRAIKEKKKNPPTAIKLEGGVKALMSRPLKKITFFGGFPYKKTQKQFR